MNNPLNFSDDSNDKLSQLSKILGHHSQKFATIAHLNNDYVANYLIGFLREGDLRLLQEKEYLRSLMNGLIALKWQEIHQINYEISYAKLYYTNPETQSEFDTVLQELMLLSNMSEADNWVHGWESAKNRL